VVKSLNKNQKKKLVMKGKGIVKKFNGNCFIYKKTRYLAKDCRNKGKKGNLMKRIV
jgi:hypothetical protein